MCNYNACVLSSCRLARVSLPALTSRSPAAGDPLRLPSPGPAPAARRASRVPCPPGDCCCPRE
jgi:hypothetical protein